MASREQVLAGMRKANEAGDIAAVNEMAAYLDNMPAAESTMMDKVGDFFSGNLRETEQQANLPELQDSGILGGESAALTAAISPALLTATDPNEIAQIISSNFPNVGVTYNKDKQGNVYPLLVNNETGAATIINRPGMSTLDVMQGIGIASAYAPTSKAATIPAAMAKAAATETGIQGVQSASGGEFNPEEVALSAGVAGVGKLAENAIGAAYRNAKGTIPEGVADVIETGKDSGVPVMTSDVIPPETFVGKTARSVSEKIPLAGTGGLRAEQQGMREGAVAQFMDKFQEPSYKDIVDSLRNKSKGIKSAAGSVLNKTGIKLDEAGEIPVTQTKESIESALEELSKPNVRVDTAAIDELSELKYLMDMPQTFTSLKENRTIARDIAESFGKGERSQLPTRSKALIQKAIIGMGKDMDEMAKDNLTPKEYGSWKKANAIYANEATKLKKSKIKNILDKGDVTPENVSTMLFSKKPSEVKSLYDSLTTKGKQNARAAIIYKAYDSAAARAGGITPNTFQSELNKIVKNTDAFFKGKDKRQLEGFKRLMSATRRAQDASVETPTGQQLIPLATGAAAVSDLGATLGLGGTAGGLARIYESAPVRNALLRLGSIPSGSDKFLSVLGDAQRALTLSAQVVRSEKDE